MFAVRFEVEIPCDGDGALEILFFSGTAWGFYFVYGMYLVLVVMCEGVVLMMMMMMMLITTKPMHRRHERSSSALVE